MELRNTEQETNEMLIVWESLRRHDSANVVVLEVPSKHPSLVLLEGATYTTYSSREGILQALESLHSKLQELEPRVKKFRQRLGEKDPITSAPRYGEKTALRVQNLLALYDALKKSTWAAFGLEWKEGEESTSDTINKDGASNSLVSNLRLEVQAQEEAKRQKELESKQQAQAQQEQERAEEERQRLEEEKKRQEAEEARLREDAEIARRAEEQRQAARQAQEAAVQAERAWIASIPKGPEGVRQQIQVLKDDTKDDLAAQSTALKSLLTIFTQIAQHPEEINFRRIRRDHPQFHQDVGRHKGGREILVAAGFQLATLDDVPVFFSKEPDLESDLDGWASWFDNLKANLEVVKEMQ